MFGRAVHTESRAKVIKLKFLVLLANLYSAELSFKVSSWTVKDNTFRHNGSAQEPAIES
jgi:hypothetical protein